MEMNQSNKQAKYLAVSTAALLVTAFALVQPAMQTAYAVGIAGGLPAYDNCSPRHTDVQEDPISMNTVKNGETVKTVHAEKEVFTCYLTQGNLPVIVDLTTYLDVYENITSKKVIATNAASTTCLKDETTATVIDCVSNNAISTSPVFVNNCSEQTTITHPQEMNTVNKGKLAKTMEAQKEVFYCSLSNGTLKKVDIVLFTETFEDLSTHKITDVKFTSARCVVMITDHSDDLQDAEVESCIFGPIEN